MPKLSEDLRGPRAPDRCQACAREGWPDEGIPGVPHALDRWVECDEDDRPTPIVVVLCPDCSRRLVGPHPRLYHELARNRPLPGSVGLCVDCRHREGTSCRLARSSGGTGLVLTIPKPARVHLCRSPRRLSGWMTLWRSPAKSCDRREVLEPAELLEGGGD